MADRRTSRRPQAYLLWGCLLTLVCACGAQAGPSGATSSPMVSTPTPAATAMPTAPPSAPVVPSASPTSPAGGIVHIRFLLTLHGTPPANSSFGLDFAAPGMGQTDFGLCGRIGPACAAGSTYSRTFAEQLGDASAPYYFARYLHDSQGNVTGTNEFSGGTAQFTQNLTISAQYSN